jgi:glycosyltransferase involved in cell wall biosynthesis
MSHDLSVSIILCTRNRVAGLQQTLESLGKVRIRSDWKAEVIVVDNGSTDETATVARQAKLRNMEVRYLYEAQRGKARGLNAGLAQARGEFILFTDDDVFVAEDWVEQLVSALLNDGCDAVTGQITLAPHLLRPWMTGTHRWWLASSHDAKLHEGSRELIGANMGFRRSVLERVREFDPELGPGALGLAEDTLFGWQLVQAGLKVVYAPKACAVHCPDASRLRRANWLNEARKHGRGDAYLAYHWKHVDVKNPFLEWLSFWMKLQLKKALHRPPPIESEGCHAWEMWYILCMEKCRQFCRERRRPRNYSQRGLVRRSL